MNYRGLRREWVLKWRLLWLANVQEQEVNSTHRDVHKAFLWNKICIAGPFQIPSYVYLSFLLAHSIFYCLRLNDQIYIFLYP